MQESQIQKRRGRPRKTVTDIADKSKEIRRRQLRNAQHAFRARKQEAQNAQGARLSKLESTLEQMSLAFLDFSDYILNSVALQHDSDAMKELLSITKRVVTLAQTARRDSTSGPTSDHGRDAFEKDELLDRGAEIPASDANSTAVPADVDHYHNTKLETTQLQPTSHRIFTAVELTSSASLESMNHSNPEMVFGNGWPHHMPIPFAKLRLKPRLRRLDLQSPTFQLLQYTLQFAYWSLLNVLDTPSDPSSRIFKFALLYHTREEILFNLRWFLGPGKIESQYLADISFGAKDQDFSRHDAQIGLPKDLLHPSVDTYALEEADIEARLGLAEEHKPFISANEVWDYLTSKGARYLDPDTVELSIHHFKTDDTTLHPISQQTSNIDSSNLKEGTFDKFDRHLNDTRYGNSDPSSTIKAVFNFNSLLGNLGTETPVLLEQTSIQDSPPMPGPSLKSHTYKIRVSVFFQNLGRIAVCLVRGPGYPRSLIDDAIWSSVINL